MTDKIDAPSCPFNGAASTPKEGDAEWHGAQMDFRNSMSYGDYLALDRILTAQHPLSPNHNEMLFIVQHQTSELWMKLMLHEMHAVRANLQADHLVHAWDVLATMTPPEYTAIRPYLGASSGFQSYQYREIEFILGNKNAALLNVHTTAPDAFAVLDKALREPSVYDEAIKLLARNGLPVSAERLNAD